MAEAFKNGGWGMIPTALFGLLLLLAAAWYAMTPEKRLVPLQVSLGLLTLSSGGLGFVSGLITSLNCMAQMPDDKRWIWLVGMGESLNNLALAFGLIALAAMAASVGALRVVRVPAAAL